MKNNEFSYWLQGYFELTGSGMLRWSDGVSMVVANHIKLVRETEGKLDEFPSWLLGFLDMKEDISENEILRIKEKLAEHFQHVIDPSYGLSPGKLQVIHDGQKPTPSPSPPPPFGGTLYRC